MQETKSTCCYCGVGCGVVIHSEAGRIQSVSGDPDHPANYGRLCSKGSTLHLTTSTQTRALNPELRHERGQPRQPVSWDTALDHVADRFAQIIEQHGPDAVGFYISGQLLTEDYYVFNKLAKGVIGTNNIDTNSRLCMSSAVVGYKATLGMDAPPACYDDIDHTDCLFIAGANTALAHPIVFRRIEAAKAKNPALKIVVVDPRRTDTAKMADLHLPVLPGTDVVLFNSMLHLMLWEGWCDQDYIQACTEGFDALKQLVRSYTPEYAAQECGISVDEIYQAAQWFAQGPTLSLYCQGLNQSVQGVQKNAALINLHLATGQIGKPGASPFSLTGQPNAMGGREVGGMANLLSGHRNLADAEHRAEVARLWGIDDVPAAPGKTAVEMFDAVQRGDIKAIWIACTNPAQSMPDLNRVTAALQAAELVVVQDAFNNTDTVAFADVLLPASTWGEKSGTVTNSERRISRVRSAVAAPGQARDDWRIVVDFSSRLTSRLNQPDLLNYQSTEQIFNEHRLTTIGRDLDIGGLSYQILETEGPQQWPYPQGAQQGKARLYEDGVFPTDSGKARFMATDYQPVAEDISIRYPLHLTSGRLRDQWHGMSRTGVLGRLYNHVQEPFVSMNAIDMKHRGLSDGDIVGVTSAQGQLTIKVCASDEMRAGQVFIPMHWGRQFMNGAGVNALTAPDFDPQSKQPELKHVAVQVEKKILPWQLVIMVKDQALTRMQQLQNYLDRFDYATLGLYGSKTSIVVFRAAHAGHIETEVLQQLDQIAGLDDELNVSQYQDARRGITKKARFTDQLLTGIRLTGEVVAQDWLKEMIASGMEAGELRPWLFAPVAEPPAGQPQRGRIVCNCLDVSELEIKQAVQNGLDLKAVQEKLKCGTQCGSCLPELKQLTAAAVK